MIIASRDLAKRDNVKCKNYFGNLGFSPASA